MTFKESTVSWEADHEQYWQGHGIALSAWTRSSTGCGATLSDAFDDALENLAQQAIEVSDAQAAAWETELHDSLISGHTFGTTIAEAFCDGHTEEEDTDCAVCAGEWHFYVSIDIREDEAQAVPSCPEHLEEHR